MLNLLIMGKMSIYFGNQEIKGNMILAPMDGYTSQPYRLFCRQLGSSASVSEFVGALEILQKHPHTKEKISFTDLERPFGYQIFDSDPVRILTASKILEDRHPDFIDVNLGCSAKHVSARGAGAGLLRHPEKVTEIITLLVANLKIPVTAKIRIGWDDSSLNYLEIAQRIEQAGAKAIAVHARTRAQGYKGKADWKAIGDIKKLVKIPVIGNGDVIRVNDVDRMINETGCDAVMIGRAALSNPWIFSGLDREAVSEQILLGSIKSLIDLMQDFYGYERGLTYSRKFISRFLVPYNIAPEARKTILTFTDKSSVLLEIQKVLL
jgi:tRNA-dihydrouridine synthase B